METLTQYAANEVANWKKFDSFAWFDKPEDANTRAIFYTSNRDADGLTRSNHTAIAERLSKYEDDKALNILNRSLSESLVDNEGN